MANRDLLTFHKASSSNTSRPPLLGLQAEDVVSQYGTPQTGESEAEGIKAADEIREVVW